MNERLDPGNENSKRNASTNIIILLTLTSLVRKETVRVGRGPGGWEKEIPIWVGHKGNVCSIRFRHWRRRYSTCEWRMAYLLVREQEEWQTNREHAPD